MINFGMYFPPRTVNRHVMLLSLFGKNGMRITVQFLGGGGGGRGKFFNMPLKISSAKYIISFNALV